MTRTGKANIAAADHASLGGAFSSTRPRSRSVACAGAATTVAATAMAAAAKKFLNPVMGSSYPLYDYTRTLSQTGMIKTR